MDIILSESVDISKKPRKKTGHTVVGNISKNNSSTSSNINISDNMNVLLSEGSDNQTVIKKRKSSATMKR